MLVASAEAMFAAVFYAVIAVSAVSGGAPPRSPAPSMQQRMSPAGAARSQSHALIQTSVATKKLAIGKSGVFPRPPVPPAERWQKKAAMVCPPRPLAALQSETGIRQLPDIVSHTKDWAGFILLKELREDGYVCPGGRFYPPNSAEFLFDCRLWKASILHSQDMGRRNYFSHISPEGRDPFDRSSPFGFPTFYENIAAGVQDAAGSLEQFKNSQEHCENMMSAEHNRAGAAYAYVPDSTFKHYWTALFGFDQSPPESDCYPSVVPTPAPSPAPTPAPAPAPPPAPPPTRTPAEECVDKDANCDYYAQPSVGYCSPSSEYYGRMQDTCAKACSFCDSPAPTPTPAPPPMPTSAPTPEDCVNRDEYCDYYASVGYCRPSSEYYGWMQDTCPKACGFCLSLLLLCEDSDADCPWWADNGYCTGPDYGDWTQANCKNSCGQC